MDNETNENFIQEIFREAEQTNIKFSFTNGKDKWLTHRQVFQIVTILLLVLLAVVLIAFCCTINIVNTEIQTIYGWIVGVLSTVLIGVIALIQGGVYKKEQDIYNQVKDCDELYIKIATSLEQISMFISDIMNKAMKYQELELIGYNVYQLVSKLSNVKNFITCSPYISEELIKRIDEIGIESASYLFNSIDKLRGAYAVKMIIDQFSKMIDESNVEIDKRPQKQPVFFEKLYNGCNDIQKSFNAINDLESFFFETHFALKNGIKQCWSKKTIAEFNQQRLDYLNKIRENDIGGLEKAGFYFETYKSPNILY